ncbi:efflux transporter outer membrane subunit [Sphingomonas sp. CROZ-RG-20F-R02-07]|uniref:efflux transporter outer membrane subunit n=1 Tax=Sphingomonas sp. CROZ-RG-20F-R02-07 TaxID=2914832 RepID=UPI001F5AEDA4|nr:efflux transporter outer membrane subunit [Sphingomonas sp. CROZ-RG-20F-R02-07]
MRRWIAAALLLGGCTVGPNFTRPQVDAPAAFGTTAADVASRTVAGTVDIRWWDSFRDPELSSLVDRLGKQNLDLQAAAERIAQARGERDIAASQGLPRLNGQGQYQRERISPNGTASLTEPAPGAPLEFNLFRTMLSAAWELDLFGRVRRAVEAARADTEAAVEARHGLALSAIADLAQTYCQLRQLQVEEGILHRNLALADQRRALVRRRFADGVATTLEVAQVDAQGLAIAQDLPTLHAQQARLVNAIGLLLAEPPRTLAAELNAPAMQPLVPPSVPVGLPADLARRRPDVREAEARLHAATAQTGVAVASFYPDISLAGNFGFESLHLGSLFDADSRAFMAGPSIDLPIFEGGRLKGTLRIRQSQQREAAIQFRKTVLQAWHDVDNALTAYAEAQHSRAAAVATSQANARALAAADQRYRDGVTTLLDVITAQEGVLRSEDSVAQAQAQMALRLIDLYRALGGGWQAVPDPTTR